MLEDRFNLDDPARPKPPRAAIKRRMVQCCDAPVSALETEEEARTRVAREAELEAIFALPAPASAMPRQSVAKRLVQERRGKPRITWRDVDRICLPGWLMAKPFAATADLLRSAGPAIARRLERLSEPQDGSRAPGRREALLQSAALWLLQSPNSARPAIHGETGGAASSRPTGGHSPASARRISAPLPRASK